MKRYTVDEVQNNQFYQMPKFLFNDEFKKLSNDARVLYSLLRDRHQLSIKNNWVNDNNEVYLIYTRTEMEKMLGLSDKTVLKAVKQLTEHGLIEEVRQGINKPNLIYLSHQTIDTSGVVKSPIQDSENLRCNNTDNNNTDILNVAKTDFARHRIKRKPTKNNKSQYTDYTLVAAADLGYAVVNGK